jgi:protein gp37
MTKIEWAHAGTGRGKTWNPIRARDRRSGKPGWHCEKVSPACANCYAERWNMRPGIGGTGLAYKPGHRAAVEIYLDEQTLLAPLHWKKPTGVFACSMTDLFADFVPTEWLDKIFAIAALCPQHIFIFLTKRAARMRAYMERFNRRRADGLGAAVISFGYDGPLEVLRWPLPNVWLGVTAEDQQRANERIPYLLATPAARRFASCEPLLGQIALHNLPLGQSGHVNALTGETLSFEGDYDPDGSRLDQIISGGETGPDARPTHIDWERALRDQCAAAGVAYFRKQVGVWKAVCEMSEEEIDACYWPAPERYPEATRKPKVRSITMHRDGEIFDDPAAAGAFLQGKGAMQMFRVGRRRAGHLLDGREHHEFPEVTQ